MPKARTGKCGFTLVELIAVIAILGVTVAIAAPATVKLIEKAEEARLIEECHMCVTAAQLLTALSRLENGEEDLVTGAEIKEAIGVTGEIVYLEFDSESELINEMTYTNGGRSVKYCRLVEPAYSFGESH